MSLKLYFSPALLLLVLVLTCPLWEVGQSLPLMAKGPMTDSCVLKARTLLQEITDTLAKNNLTTGINCKQQSVEINTGTETASACTPKGSTCSGSMKSEFNQESCLTNIGEDLHYFYTFLGAQPDPNKFLTSVLRSLRELVENCLRMSLPPDLSSKEAAADRPSDFSERLTFCKELKGFQVRTITINRAIAYMNSGEHTK